MADNKRKSFWLHFAAGGMGGTVGAAVTCPLEVVKTRLQSSLYKMPEAKTGSLRLVPAGPLRIIASHVTGVVSLMGSISQKEGIAALWKGLGPNLVGVVPARAIYFSCYSQGKHFYTSLNKNKETPLVHTLSALSAGVMTAMATNPIWLIKTRMQLQSMDSKSGTGPRYRSNWHCLNMILKEEGVRGLYKGLSASFLGLSESTLQFVLYEQFKRILKERKQDRQFISSATTSPSLLQQAQAKVFFISDWADTFTAAAGAKLIAAVITYPHEVLRTRMRQTPEQGGGNKYKGLWKTTKTIYVEEGFAALYGGITAHLMRVIPNAMILFATVELVLHVNNGTGKGL
ncbi:hypothetical protein HDU76_004488 [Blyttiomyces sp. JEL0837]|nr:hypothetical protein HDU76_004488 [Blyttiomyces sp. JEL0837]